MLTYISNSVMKLRADHTVLSNQIGGMTLGGTARGSEVYTAPADGEEQKAGDQWLHVVQISDALGTREINGWMAIKHLGITLMSQVAVANTQYYQVKYDWQVGIKPRDHCPAIVNPMTLEHNRVSKKWLDFWFSLNRTGNAALDAKAWQSYTNSKSFLMDGTGTDTSDPKIENKVCCGNVVKVIGKPVVGRMGRTYIQIETLDITKDPPQDMTYATAPHLIQHATNYPSVGRCDPFPHLGGRATGRPVYFPVTSRGVTLIETKWLRKLAEGETLPNPYNPPMAF